MLNMRLQFKISEWTVKMLHYSQANPAAAVVNLQDKKKQFPYILYCK